MKIAVLAPVAWRTPPSNYGPWEQIASNICEGLVNDGVDVTLFATGNSRTEGRLDAIIPQGYEEDKDLDAKVCECLHISNLMQKAKDFDLIHNHFDFLPLTYSRLIPTPMVTTIHGFSSTKIIQVYEKYNAYNDYVSISHADRSDRLNYRANIYHGVNPEDFTYNANPSNYLLFFGRIHHDKGAFEAIQIALKAKMPLLLAGFIQDQQYFNEKVAPWLNDRIRYIGNAPPPQRDKLLGGAIALLHPINFEEPFGLSVAEALICGTPVVAFDRGSMKELIQHQETGFLVKTIDEAVEVLNDIKSIDRETCSKWGLLNFSQQTMVQAYKNLYMDILHKEPEKIKQ